MFSVQSRHQQGALTRCFLPLTGSPTTAPRPTNLDTLSVSSAHVNGSLSQNTGVFPPPQLKIYLGLVFSIISSTGGEPTSGNPDEGNGTDESSVILEGQSCEMNTSINGEELRADIMDERRGALDAGEETVLDSSFETVRDV